MRIFKDPFVLGFSLRLKIQVTDPQHQQPQTNPQAKDDEDRGQFSQVHGGCFLFHRSMTNHDKSYKAGKRHQDLRGRCFFLISARFGS